MQLRYNLGDWLGLLLSVALAAVLRFGYLNTAVDQGRGVPALVVQGESARREHPADTELRGKKNPSEMDELVDSMRDGAGPKTLAPLSDSAEKTAHVAPGYPWLFAQISRLDVEADMVMRWLQATLGVLTVGCYFCFARRGFGSSLAALFAGLLAAVHPFWILNVAELEDGTLATFLLAAALTLGARGTQVGGVFTSLVFGISLGALAMVRAAFLPFALAGLMWFLLRSRHVRLGWLCALVAFLGFANVLAPWVVRNFKVFGEPVAIVDSTYLHLWIGNNAKATGGPMDEKTLRESLPEEKLPELLEESNQVKRYLMLARPVLEQVQNDPQGFWTHRIQSTLVFFLGESWLRNRTLASTSVDAAEAMTPPEWLEQWCETALQASLLILFLLGALGWRWSFGWRKHSRMAALAAVWLPLPYILSHGEMLSGPRLPLDGVLICFAAFALAHLNPALAREPRPEAIDPNRPRKEPRTK